MKVLLTCILFASALSLPVFAVESETTRLQKEEANYPSVAEAISQIRAAKLKLEDEWAGDKLGANNGINRA